MLGVAEDHSGAHQIAFALLSGLLSIWAPPRCPICHYLVQVLNMFLLNFPDVEAKVRFFGLLLVLIFSGGQAVMQDYINTRSRTHTQWPNLKLRLICLLL